MKTLGSRRWFLYVAPVFLLLVFSGIMLASEAQDSPQVQTEPTATATPEETADVTATATPSSLDYSMYFLSQVQDTDTCAMNVENGELVFDALISNPAVTCPDMFAWKLFLDAIEEEFWINWAADQYTWPEEPLPLCQPDAADRSACCTLDSLENPGYDDPENPGLQCPYFPADHLEAGTEMNILETHIPAIAQDDHFTSPVPQDDADPGRVIRQEMAELVFRNKPLFDYVFENNLYNTNGLADVFARSQESLKSGAPYQQRNASGELVRIDFPVDSVMIKTNWLHESRAAELGLVDNPEHPYITMQLNSSVTDNNGTIFETGLHYLLAVHISSKDTPDWVWATFEHVDNPGRCDMTGCNDSFGYFAPDEVADNMYRNYTAPHTRSDNLLIPSTVFDTGLQYDGGEITPALATIFSDLGIGTADGDLALPSPSDSAWLSYRLKGSQTEFTMANGRPSRLGNSVTEAGFVNTSSCITCHNRAAVDAAGDPALGVFLSKMGEDGYAEASVGSPDPNWYYSSSNNPSLQALQTDFVWGILFASPLATPETDGE